MLGKIYLKESNITLLYWHNFPPHVSNTACLLLSTLLIPEWEPSLLPQCSIHGAAVKALTSVIAGSFHILSGQLQSGQLDAMFVGHGHRVPGIFDS